MSIFTVSEVIYDKDDHTIKNKVTIHENYRDAIIKYYKRISKQVKTEYEGLILTKTSEQAILEKIREISKEIWYNKNENKRHVAFSNHSIFVDSDFGVYNIKISSNDEKFKNEYVLLSHNTGKLYRR